MATKLSWKIVLIACIGSVAICASAFQRNPHGANGGADPSARTFTDKQLEAQQASPHVVPPVATVPEPEPRSNTSDIPSSSDGGGRLAGAAPADRGPVEKVNGLQVLQQAERTVQSGSGSPWPAILGLLLFASTGFGAVAYVRNWADKKAPRLRK